MVEGKEVEGEVMPHKEEGEVDKAALRPRVLAENVYVLSAEKLSSIKWECLAISKIVQNAVQEW